MSDVRLIDANALKLRAINVSTVRSHTYMKAVGTREIDKAPTIDAVPVVRCKDCKFAEKTIWSSGEMYCVVWKMNPRPEGYCYLGEKQEGER